MWTRAGTIHSLSYRYVSRYLFHDTIRITIHELFWHSTFFITKQCLLEQNNNVHLLSPCTPAAIFKHYSVWLNLQKTEHSGWLWIKFFWEVIFRIKLVGIVFLDRYFTKRIDTRIGLTKDRYYRYFDILSQP